MNKNAVAENELTSNSCSPRDPICSFSCILFSSFYASAGNVEGSGAASMLFDTTRTRTRTRQRERDHRLADTGADDVTEHERIHALQEVASNSVFDIFVGVAQLDCGPGTLLSAGVVAIVGTMYLVTIASLASMILFLSTSIIHLHLCSRRNKSGLALERRGVTMI